MAIASKSKLPTKVKVLSFALLASLCLGKNIDFSQISNIKIQEAKFLSDWGWGLEFQDECRMWKLSSNELKELLSFSTYYPNRGSSYHEFNQFPCEIHGSFTANGKHYDFVINGGGEIILFDSLQTGINLGCKKKECEKFVLFPHDGMAE